MSLWRHLSRGVRALANRRAADRDVADEVRHWFDLATAELIARGLSPEEARRAVRLELGSAAAAGEQVRSSGWEHVVSTVVVDLRYAARRLRGSPGFTAVASLTLALGVGAATAIFSAVRPVLFEPMPYPHSGRIVMISDHATDGTPIDVTFGTYRELVARSRSVDALAVMKPWQPTLAGRAEPERLDGQRVSAGFLRVLGVPPALGRDFVDADDQPGAPRVVILADALWRRRFGGDPAVVGREITLDGDLFTVIGVMPSTFEDVLAPEAELWAPLRYDRSLPPEGREWGHHLRMIGRLAPGADVRRATRELGAIAHAPVAEFARPRWASLEAGLIVHSLRDDLTRGVRPALLAILGAVTLVLAVACVNVTHLLLGRGARRRGELAMRAALGAGRARLIRQLLTESTLLAGIGGVLGMMVAALGVRALVALSPPDLPRASAIRVDGAAFGVALAITTAIGLLVGLVPALQASRGDLHPGIQAESPRTAGGRQVTRATLVVAEVALALVLLVGAGLLRRSMQRLFAVAPGFIPARVLTMQVQAVGHRFDDAEVARRFFTDALDAVRRVPGVTAAAFTSELPLSGDGEKYGVHFESSPNDDPDEDHSAFRYGVTPEYFETMRIPLRHGRLLDAHDAADAPRVVLINESFARRKFPGRSPIGQRVHVGPTTEPWFTIVGVVGNVKQMSLAAGAEDAAYVASAQWNHPDNPRWLVVRARWDAAALAPAVERAVWSVDREQPIVRVSTMDAVVARSAAERRFVLILFETFAAVALLLCAVGIYGVVAAGVAERTREIGVRSALGASRERIVALVLRRGMSLAAVGLAIGLAVAVVASHAIVTLLFGVSPLDPITYAGVVALLASVSALACCLPAWRAARVDPSITLRAE
ncbi:MAG TPA: ABC transporter permease [Gemmatimonadaceae bacterium]|nr:ABC transporter permease [Gemmatimonadaceae bacterium]